MIQIPLSIAPIGDICRTVPEDGFHPFLDGDAMVRRLEALPRYASPDLFFDREEDVDAAELRTYLCMEGRRDTFIAHFGDALVVPDVMCVVASGNRVPFPNTYCEDSPAQAREFYFGRSEMLSGIEKHGPYGIVEWDLFLNPADGTPVYQVDEPHVLLANQSAINYWHFLTEIIPRLWPYETWPDLRSLPVIVRRKGDSFETVLAEAIGVPTSRLFALDRKALYRFKHLIVPSALCDRALTETKVAFIRSKVAEGVVPVTDGPRRRFFLSRADRGARGIVNEAEVLATLARYGVEPIVPSDLSIREQAELFGSAEMLIGPHGAALTNMLFMAPGSVVMELAARPWGPLFYSLAAACRQHYMALGSQWDFHPFNHRRRAERRNPLAMTFDTERLAAAVEAGLRRLASGPGR